MRNAAAAWVNAVSGGSYQAGEERVGQYLGKLGLICIDPNYPIFFYIIVNGVRQPPPYDGV